MKINFNKYVDVHVQLVKLKDIKFEGDHPNGVNEGYIADGMVDIERSKMCNALFVDNIDRWFHTSAIVDFEEKEGYDLITTQNSIYKVIPRFSGLTGAQKKFNAKLV